jgi:hypothetical protein
VLVGGGLVLLVTPGIVSPAPSGGLAQSERVLWRFVPADAVVGSPYRIRLSIAPRIGPRIGEIYSVGSNVSLPIGSQQGRNGWWVVDGVVRIVVPRSSTVGASGRSAVVAVKVNGTAACQIVLLSMANGGVRWRSLDLFQGEVLGSFAGGSAVVPCINIVPLRSIQGGMNRVSVQIQQLGVRARSVRLIAPALTLTRLSPYPLAVKVDSLHLSAPRDGVAVLPYHITFADSRIIPTLSVVASASGGARIVGSTTQVFHRAQRAVSGTFNIRVGKSRGVIRISTSLAGGADATATIVPATGESSHRTIWIGFAICLVAACVSTRRLHRWMRGRPRRVG